MYNSCLYRTFSSGMEENANVIFLSSGVRFRESTSFDTYRHDDDEYDGTEGNTKACVMPLRENECTRRRNEMQQQFIDF